MSVFLFFMLSMEPCLYWNGLWSNRQGQSSPR